MNFSLSSIVSFAARALRVAAVTLPFFPLAPSHAAALDRYVVIVAPINTEVKQPSFLEVPVAGVVKLFEVALPGIGTAIAESYSREADNRYAQPMRVAAAPDQYTIVRAHTIEESVSGAGARGWSGIGTSTATFRWELRRKGFFEGSSWLGGAAIAVALRNGEAPNEAEADAVLKAAIANVASQLEAAAAVRRKAADDAARAQRIQEGRREPGSMFPGRRVPS